MTLAQFNQRQLVAVPYLVANNLRLLYPDALLAELTTSMTSWATLYAASENPTTRTTPVVRARLDLLRVYDRQFRAMQQTLKRFPGLVLTDEDLANLYIVPDRLPSPNPPPTIVPAITVISLRPLLIKFQVSEPEAPQLNYRRLPPQVTIVNVFRAFGNVGEPAPLDADYDLIDTGSKATITLTFQETERNRLVYLKAQFGNRQGFAGRGTPITASIPA